MEATGLHSFPDSVPSKGICQALLAWFADSARPLPWRIKRSLFGTWVAEIMLQQTTVAAVIPYWERFMARFPEVESLASAELEEILALWSGLGYYRRAENLHRAANIIVDQHSGKLPATRRQWTALPGVGVYTSGAIASQGLGEVVPAVDANARRVLCRWFFAVPDQAARLKPKELEQLAAEMVDPEQPGNWNEAIMELGATLCRPKTPDCPQCPVLDFCQAGLAGVTELIPQSQPKSGTTEIALAMVVLRRGSSVLLLPPGTGEKIFLSGNWDVGRADISGLHQGFWELPTTPWYLNSPKVFQALEQKRYVQEWITKKLGLDSLLSENLIFEGPRFKHSITRFRLRVKVWNIQLPSQWNSKVARGFPQGKQMHFPTPDSPIEGERILAKGTLERAISQLVEKALRLPNT